MEKAATYTVMSPPHPCKRSWVAWVAVGVSVVAVVVACVTAAVVNEQASLVDHLEGRLMEMESHIEEVLRLTIANNEYDYQDYDGDYDYLDDEKDGQKEGITVRRVVRRRRQVNSVENELPDASNVPIYEQSYGINLKQSSAARKGLRLYDSLLDTEEDEDESTSEDVPEATDSPIKPHHRTVVRQVDSTDGDSNELVDNFFPSSPSSLHHRSRLTQRNSRTQRLHGSRRELKRQQKQRVRSNQARGSVVYRTSHVKATLRHDGFSGRDRNSVVPREPSILPEAPKVVQQEVSGRAPVAVTRAPTSRLYGRKKNKKHRRRRRARPIITLAHFGASVRNFTTQHEHLSRGEHLDWTPAPWMDKLGLHSKYSLDRGTVTVKEPGLYYLYAQVLYESGRSGAGFQILVDDIPVLECQVPAMRPAPTCLTGGLSYLPRNGEVRVQDLDNNLTTVRRHQNTFFGLVKLMGHP